MVARLRLFQLLACRGADLVVVPDLSHCHRQGPQEMEVR